MSLNIPFNIIANNHRCKKYKHNGKTWIEAKEGSIYEIEIKNNTWDSVLAIVSVDGLNVISGTHESIDIASGYIIQSYCSEKIDGFRYSDNNVSKFQFSNKEQSYASSKNNDAVQNCGIIGIRIFNRKSEILYNTPNNVTKLPTIDLISTQCPEKINTTYNSSNNSSQSITQDNIITTYNTQNNKFDMGTKWGQSKHSPTIQKPFVRNIMIYSYDIYYASRIALLKMGIPLKQSKVISIPKSFPTTYAKPPENWNANLC